MHSVPRRAHPSPTGHIECERSKGAVQNEAGSLVAEDQFIFGSCLARNNRE
jgi:hypothetical protein